jgi:CubicO group peptidase (beta-lactamase class C family)
MFWADGYEGQFVAIIPSKQLVIVRLGLSKYPWDEDAMFKAILKAF